MSFASDADGRHDRAARPLSPFLAAAADNHRGLFALTLAMCAFSALAAILKVTRLDPVMVLAR